jgi:hypothetical protein
MKNTKLKEFFADKKFRKKMYIALFFYLLAVLLPSLTSSFIQKKFHEPPVVRDLLWEILPNIKVIWLSEIFLIASLIFVFIWALKKDKNYIPYTILLISLFQIIRAGLIVLTPLGFPDPYNGLIPVGEDTVFAFGAFPSGHLSYPILTYLITKSNLMLLFSFIVGTILIISHSHYSIDIVGTIFITFALYAYFERKIKKYFINNP